MSESMNVTELYNKRREKLLNEMGEGIALINVSQSAPDSLLYDKNLEYLVGPVPDDSVLILAPKGIMIDRFETLRGPELGRGHRVKQILFTRELSDREKIVDGENSSTEDLRNETGVPVIKSLSRLNQCLKENLISEGTLWVNISHSPDYSKPVTPDIAKINEIKERSPWLQLKNVASLIHKMRWVKDRYEVDCLRNAFQIHSEIYEKIMIALKPGINERVGKAIFDYEIGIRDPLKVSGQWYDRYESNIIVASGKNTVVAHYMDNNQIIKKDDLILIDAGVEYGGYCSDITRTFPANGIFTDRQRELYEIVLEAQNRAIAEMKPGNTQIDAHRAAYEYLKEHGLEKHGYGRAGHPVGLNIHDTADWNGGDKLLFEP
ncbi:MAG: M24 family metallopeptidase, partial [Candidatus Hodarchaeales archaeon]